EEDASRASTSPATDAMSIAPRPSAVTITVPVDSEIYQAIQNGTFSTESTTGGGPNTVYYTTTNPNVSIVSTLPDTAPTVQEVSGLARAPRPGQGQYQSLGGMVQAQ